MKRTLILLICCSVLRVVAEEMGKFVPREQIDVVYFDSGRFYFAYTPKDCKSTVPLHLYCPKEEVQNRYYYLPVTLSPFQIFCSPDAPPLSLFWFVKDRTPFAVMGDIGSSAIRQYLIYLCPGVVENNPVQTIPDKVRKESCHIGPRPYRGICIKPLIGCKPDFEGRDKPYYIISGNGKNEDRAIRKPPNWKRLAEMENLWCGLSSTSLLVRLPVKEPTMIGGWKPVANPDQIRWVELLYDCRTIQNPDSDFSLVHAQILPWEGFTPIAITRVAGRKIKRDDQSIAVPQDADWLIWEKNTNGVVRLCQMKGGRWSPVREVPRAPQTIVVDNDTETVHLLYNFAIDRADIDGSLRRLASLLKPPQPAP